MNYIIQNNIKYYYEHKQAKHGDICLATKDPTTYCNGIYKYSIKDPGSAKQFVAGNVMQLKNRLRHEAVF